MWAIITLCFLFASAYGHSSNKLQNEADMQSSLMPQELNPAFVTNKDEPWRAIMPVPRMRRDVQEAPMNLPSQLQSPHYELTRYSRITASVVIAVAALVELILYVLDYWA